MGASSSPHWPRPSPHDIAGPSAATASSDCTPHTCNRYCDNLLPIHLPALQRLQQAPAAGGSVSCSKTTAWLLPNSHQLSLLRPYTRPHSSTLPHTYTHTRTKYCDNTPPTHSPACTNTTNYACTNVCKCVWVCRASGSDACADAEARSTAAIMKPCCCQGCTYIKYGHPLLVVTLMYHFYNKLVVGIMIMISKQIFLF